MEYTNTRVEDLCENILSAIESHRYGYVDCHTTLDLIEKITTEFRNKYCCPYEKYTAEWYDKHGE
jgi:hypothetical protein